jgi:hypothetical protein
MGAALLTLSDGYRLEAQAQDPVSSEVERPWEFVASLGGPLGGPGDAIEEAMRASGWDDTSLGDVEHPFSSGSEISWALSLRRSLGPHLEVELMANRSTTGTTLGYDGTDVFLGHHLFLSHSATTLAPIVSYRVGSLHVGAGPAANQVHLERTDLGGGGSREEWKLGALADIGITFPRRSRLFFEGRGQYRWIPGTEVGPFTSGNGLPEDVPSTMPAVDIDMSHAFVTVGLGARF